MNHRERVRQAYDNALKRKDIVQKEVADELGIGQSNLTHFRHKSVLGHDALMVLENYLAERGLMVDIPVSDADERDTPQPSVNEQLEYPEYQFIESGLRQILAMLANKDSSLAARTAALRRSLEYLLNAALPQLEKHLDNATGQRHNPNHR